MHDTGWRSLGNGVSYRAKNGYVTVCGNSNGEHTVPAFNDGYLDTTIGIDVAYLPHNVAFAALGSLKGTTGYELQITIGAKGEVKLLSLSNSPASYWGFIFSYPYDERS